MRVVFGSANYGGTISRRRGCQFAGTPSTPLLIHLLKVDGGVGGGGARGGQQNDSLADG